MHCLMELLRHGAKLTIKNFKNEYPMALFRKIKDFTLFKDEMMSVIDERSYSQNVIQLKEFDRTEVGSFITLFYPHSNELDRQVFPPEEYFTKSEEHRQYSNLSLLQKREDENNQEEIKRLESINSFPNTPLSVRNMNIVKSTDNEEVSPVSDTKEKLQLTDKKSLFETYNKKNILSNDKNFKFSFARLSEQQSNVSQSSPKFLEKDTVEYNDTSFHIKPQECLEEDILEEKTMKSQKSGYKSHSQESDEEDNFSGVRVDDAIKQSPNFYEVVSKNSTKTFEQSEIHNFDNDNTNIKIKRTATYNPTDRPKENLFRSDVASICDSNQVRSFKITFSKDKDSNEKPNKKNTINSNANWKSGIDSAQDSMNSRQSNKLCKTLTQGNQGKYYKKDLSSQNESNMDTNQSSQKGIRKIANNVTEVGKSNTKVLHSKVSKISKKYVQTPISKYYKKLTHSIDNVFEQFFDKTSSNISRKDNEIDGQAKD